MMPLAPEQASSTPFCDQCISESSPQSPGQVNVHDGIGRKFYGRDAACSTCGSVVRTLWWVLIDIPVVPLGSYRYKTAGDEEHAGFFVQRTSQSFLARRTGTNWGQVAKTWAVGWAVAAAAIPAYVFIQSLRQ